MMTTTAAASATTTIVATASAIALGAATTTGAHRCTAVTADIDSATAAVAAGDGYSLRNHDAGLNLDLFLDLNRYANVDRTFLLNWNTNGYGSLAIFSRVSGLRNLTSASFFNVVAELNLTGTCLSLVAALLNGASARFLTATSYVARTGANFRTATGHRYWTCLLLDAATGNGAAARLRTTAAYTNLTSASLLTAAGDRYRPCARFGAAQSNCVVVLLGGNLVLIGRARNLFCNDVWNPNATAYRRARRCARCAGATITAATG